MQWAKRNKMIIPTAGRQLGAAHGDTIFTDKKQPDFRNYDYSIAISEDVSVISGRFDEYKAQLQYAYSPDTICRKGLHLRRVYDMIGTDSKRGVP